MSSYYECLNTFLCDDLPGKFGSQNFISKKILNEKGNTRICGCKMGLRERGNGMKVGDYGYLLL